MSIIKGGTAGRSYGPRRVRCHASRLIRYQYDGDPVARGNLGQVLPNHRTLWDILGRSRQCSGGTRVRIAVQSHSRYGKDDMLYENQLPNDLAESLPIPSTSNVIRAASQDIDELAREWKENPMRESNESIQWEWETDESKKQKNPSILWPFSRK